MKVARIPVSWYNTDMDFTIANAEKNTLSRQNLTNKYEINYSVDINNDNDSHSILAKNALGAKNVLDVGCGTGHIGRIIKSIYPETKVDGIDIDHEASDICKKHYDNVMVMCLGDESDKAFRSFLKQKKMYDCIICGDIIEHLQDPGLIISILAKKLSPKGKLLVSIPNVAHIDVVANLIDGRFNYGETGILDNTHLRFFTESSFYEFVDNVNHHYGTSLSPKRIARTIVEHPILDTRYFKEICGDEIFTFQNIFELRKTKKPVIPQPKPKQNYHDIIVAIDKGKDLQSVKNSFSWKITEPLRRIYFFFRRNK